MVLKEQSYRYEPLQFPYKLRGKTSELEPLFRTFRYRIETVLEERFSKTIAVRGEP